MVTSDGIDINKVNFGIPYIHIPEEVFLNPALTAIDKLTFGILQNLSLSSSGCQATDEYLSKIVQCNRHTVQRALRILNENKYIIIKWVKIGDHPDVMINVRRIFIDTNYKTRYRSMVKNFHNCHLNY